MSSRRTIVVYDEATCTKDLVQSMRSSVCLCVAKAALTNHANTSALAGLDAWIEVGERQVYVVRAHHRNALLKRKPYLQVITTYLQKRRCGHVDIVNSLVPIEFAQVCAEVEIYFNAFTQPLFLF